MMTSDTGAGVSGGAGGGATVNQPAIDTNQAQQPGVGVNSGASGGGSIPVVAEIADLMDIPVVMMGYGLDDDGLHSPNERFSIEMFHRGIETAIIYLEELSQA